MLKLCVRGENNLSKKTNEKYIWDFCLPLAECLFDWSCGALKKITSSVIDFLLSAQISQGRKATVLQNSSVECKIKVFRSFFYAKNMKVSEIGFFSFPFLFFLHKKKAHKFSRYRNGTFYVYMNLCTHRESWESINCAKKYIFFHLCCY